MQLVSLASVGQSSLNVDWQTEAPPKVCITLLAGIVIWFVTLVNKSNCFWCLTPLHTIFAALAVYSSAVRDSDCVLGVRALGHPSVRS